MSMHLTHAGLTTLNTGRNKKKPSVRQNRAAAEHDKWLRSQGLHPEQIAQRQKNKTKKATVDASTSSMEKISSLGNGFAPIVAKRSVFDSVWRRDYEDDPLMAEREAIALQQAEEKKKRIAPAYSKGAYQYISEGTDLKDIGRKK
jgi:hypothetical protein